MRNWPRYIVQLLLIVAIVWSAGLIWFMAQVPTTPVSSSEATDAIVVLTGGGQRLEHGFSMLAGGRAPILFISGVQDNVSLSALLRKEDVAPYLTHIPPENIIIGRKARSTIGNAEETAEWAKHAGIKSIRLVTGNYHMPRSLYEFHQAAPNLVIIPEPVFPNSGARYFELIVSEYHKFIASIIEHALMNANP